MNKILKPFCLLCLLWAWASCNKAPEYYTLETPADQMFLKTSVADITLEKAKEKETAVTFTWNKAADRGVGGSITYLFRMYMADLASNVTQLYNIDPSNLSISFTHEQLNDILTNWDISAGDNTTIEAEVIAQTNDGEKYVKPELSKTQLNVVGYIKNVEALYIVTIDGSGAKEVRRMPEKTKGSAIYETSMVLPTCHYYFALSADADYPAYMKGTEGDLSLQHVAEAGNYEQLENTVAGKYTVTVDLNTLTVTPEFYLCPLPQNNIWIVGAATDIGWDMGRAESQGALKNHAPQHPELWTYTGRFYANGAEFKLSVEHDWGGKFFFAPYQGAFPTKEHQLSEPRNQDNGGDLKWFVETEGNYTLTVNLNLMTIDLTPNP